LSSAARLPNPDDGYQGGSYPASSFYVTAVVGSSLNKAADTRSWTEMVWSGAGSGRSLYNTALAADASANTGCAKRAMADVSAVADPNTGVVVYDSTAYKGSSGWMVFGGTPRDGERRQPVPLRPASHRTRCRPLRRLTMSGRT